MKKLQQKIFLDTEISPIEFTTSDGYSIGQVIHFNDTGNEFYHKTDGIWSSIVNMWESVIISSSTTLHPRWDDSDDSEIYGTDRFGFGASPTGVRASGGEYMGVGESVVYHSSINSSFGIDFDVRDTYSEYTNFIVGYSVRAVRTATTEEQLLPDGLISATYTDYDGNVYQCTKIGSQVWTISNLKVTHYADGAIIPTNLSDTAWVADTDGACAVYGKNDGAFVPTDELDTEAKMVAVYGRLYNWYAVNNTHGLIDTTDGWHVPTDAEFTQLTDYLIATYPEITSDNIGNVLKSVRQVNSPYVITDQVHIKPKLNKRIDASIIDNLPSGNTSTPIIEKTYLELTTLIASSGLTSGQQYLITDYQTVHTIPNVSNVSNVQIVVGTPLEIGVEYIVTYLGSGDDFSNVGYISTNIPFIATNTTPNVWVNGSLVYQLIIETNTGTIEPLIVTSMDSVNLYIEAYSSLFPKDIIYYNIDNNQDVVPGCTKGYIYRRIDTIQNNDLGFDFRNVKFRRWQIDVTNIWSDVSTYSKSDVVLEYGTSNIYICLKNNVIGDVLTNQNNWLLFGFSNLDYISPNETTLEIGNSIIPCSNLYQDYNMFINYDITFVNNTIKNDIIDILNANNTVVIGNDFNNNTIGNNFSQNIIGNNFSQNIIGNNFSQNIIGDGFSSNTIGYEFSSNTIGNGFNNNTIGYEFSSNTIGNNFESNMIGNGFSSNTIGYDFFTNTIGDWFNNNTIGYEFSSNTIGDGFSSNTIGNNFESNMIGNGFSSNTIGNEFKMNNVCDNFGGLDFTLATHVYSSYSTELFINSDFSKRLIYDKTTIVDANA